jgi:hypothetical protein
MRLLNLANHLGARNVWDDVHARGRNTAREAPAARGPTAADPSPHHTVTITFEKECGDRQTEKCYSHELGSVRINEEPL